MYRRVTTTSAPPGQYHRTWILATKRVNERIAMFLFTPLNLQAGWAASSLSQYKVRNRFSTMVYFTMVEPAHLCLTIFNNICYEFSRVNI